MLQLNFSEALLMEKMRFLLSIILISAITFQLTAQEVNPNSKANPDQFWVNDTTAGKMAVEQVNENLEFMLSDKIDSMMNSWYTRKAFSYSALNQDNLVREELKTPLPDSIYIKRLQAIDSYIPLSYNETVKNLIGLYTIRKRGLTSIIMGMSNYYFPLFEEALERYNLPHELKYLPIIESALNPKAYSRAGASGLWQFMTGTGKMYGLEINTYVDERNDPIKSTDAAARYLRDLYNIYGDWHLVIAAYNCGPGNVNKAVRRSGGKQNYWEIYYSLPKETRGYIPAFIAAVYMMNYAKEHELVAAEPSFKTVSDTVEVKTYLNFDQIAANIGVSVDELKQLNPQYRRNVIPAKPEKPYILKLPLESVSPFIDKEKDIYAWSRDRYFPNNQIVAPVAASSHQNTASVDGKKKIYYTVRSGDNVGAIAAKYRVSVTTLKSWNNLRSNMIRVGQKLAIYVPDNSPKKETPKVEVQPKVETPQTAIPDEKIASAAGRDSTAVASIVDSMNKPVDAKEFVIYTVQRGDSLYTIAQKFQGITIQDIKELNNFNSRKVIHPGDQIKIPKRA